MNGRLHRAYRYGFVILTIGLGVLMSCAGEKVGVSNEEVQLASDALAPFKKELKQALMTGMKKGPENAIEVCRVEAPIIASSVSAKGIEMGRTSHRLRNPANAPEPWMKPLLADYRASNDDRTYRAVRLEDGGVGYVEPIYIQPLCLKCHGEEVSEEIAKQIEELYPEDEAIGFQSGEFRGLFWVRLEPKASE